MAHKWAEVLHHPCVLGGPQTRRHSQRWPTSGRRCYITPAFSGVPNQGDKVNGGPQVGGTATSPLRSRGSPNKTTKSKVAHKWAEVLHHPCVLGGPQTRVQSQRWPTSGRKCYIVPPFSGVPEQGDKFNGGPKVGGSATSPLRSWGSPDKTTKSMVAHKWAEVLHNPCVLGGHQTRRQSQWWPTSGRRCYITLAFSGFPNQGDKVNGGPQVSGSVTSPLRSRGSPNKTTKSKVADKRAEVLYHPCVLGGPQTRRQSQWWPTSRRRCYITLAFSGVPKQGDKVNGGPQLGGSAISSLRSRGAPNKGTKSMVAKKWAEVLHHPSVLGCPQTRGQSQCRPTSEREYYITPAFWEVPQQRDKVKGGPQVGGSATSSLRSRGSPSKGTKSKVAHKWAEVLHHPCVLGGPQTRGQSQRWPTSGRKCYITTAFSGVPKQGDEVNGGPQLGGSATSFLRSRRAPNKGTKSMVAHQWAEVLHHPCVLRSPQTRGQSQWWPTSGRKCYIIPAFSGVPKQGDKVKGRPQVGGSATSPLRSRGSPNKGTKSMVAHNWAEVLHHPCVLGGPQTRGQSQWWPTSGRKCYITPAFSGVPKQGDKVNGGPQVGGSATSPLRSRGSLNKGKGQGWPTSWRTCYITPAFAVVLKQDDKVNGGPQVGGRATSPLHSRGSPNKGTKSKVAHKWAEVLHHPCVLGGPQKTGTKSKMAHQWAEVLHHPGVLRGPQTRRQSQRWPTSGRRCYITPAFSGVPKQDDKVKGGPQVGGGATSPLRSRGSPINATTSMVAHKWAEVLHHPCVLGGPQKRGQGQRWSTSGRRCYITPALSGFTNQGDNVNGGPQVGGSATSPLRSRGSPNKTTKSKVAHKWAEVLHHPCVLGGPQTRGQGQWWPTSGRKCYITPAFSGVPKTRGRSQWWPTSGRKCYITPAFSGVPKQDDRVKGGPQVGGGATSPLRSRGSANKGTKPKVAHKWAEVLHHPCVLGGPQTRRQSQRWPTSGRRCYITPAFLGVPKQDDKVKGCPQVGRGATSPLRSRGSPIKGKKSMVAHKWAEVLRHPCVLGGPQTRGQSQRWPTSGRRCYITPAFSGVPKHGDKVIGGSQVGGSATSSLRSRGSPNKGTNTTVAHKWAEVLCHTCVLGGPQTRGQSQWWPTSGRKCYITPAFSGVPLQGDKVNGGPPVGGTATSPLRSRGSPNTGTASKVAHKWAEVLHHPCVLGGFQTRGQSQWWPTIGRKCYITPAFSGVPKQGDKVKGGPQVGGSATSSLRSWGSPNKGTKSMVAHKWAEVLHHPRVLGGTPTRGQSKRWPTSGRNCYITPAVSGVPKHVDKVNGGPPVGGGATSPLRSRGSQNTGTKSKVAHKWAEVLHHPCALGGPKTRGQSQTWPTSGRRCYITPAFSGVPKKGDKVKGGPQVGGSAESPLRSGGSPNKGTKSMVAQKGAEVLHHPCVLGGPETRGQGQWWPTSGRKCYIIPAFSGVPKQGDKIKGGPQVGGSATSPLRSRGSPNKGTKTKVAHKWAEELYHPCVLGGPQTRGQSHRWLTSGRKCYITPAFSGVPEQGDKHNGGPQVGGSATSHLRSRGSPNKGTKSMVAHKWAEVLHHPCILGGTPTRGQSQRWSTSWRKCYITPALSGVPKHGDKVKGGPQVGGSATSPLRSRGSPNKGTKSMVAHQWAELLHRPCVLGGPQTRGQRQGWHTSGRKCYITPAFSGVPKQGDKVNGGPPVGGSATSPLRSRGSPNKGTKSEVAHKWAEVLHHPRVLGGTPTRGQSQRWPTSGRNCYITPAFSGVPKHVDKVNGGPPLGGGATSPLRSRGSPNTGTKSKVAHKWAEVLHHPCTLGGPKTRGQSQRWPTSGRRCYITPAFSGVSKKGDKVKGGPQVGGSAESPLCSGGSPNKGTKSMVAQKGAEVLHHPCFLSGPGTRGQNQRWPTSGRRCYITPPFWGVPKQGDKVKSGPQVGGSATSPLRSRLSPNTGTKSKVAHKWAEVPHHPCVLGVPQSRRHSQWWPTSGRKCYITPAFSGVPKKGDKVKGGPQVGGGATSPLRSQGSPIKGIKSMVAHKWAEVLHHPCVLGCPQTRRQSQRWPTSGRRCYITPAFSGFPNQDDIVNGGPQVGGSATSPLRSRGSPKKGTRSKVVHKWAEVLHHPCVLRVPQSRG